MATIAQARTAVSNPQGEERKLRPVKLWATIGVAVLALQLFIYGKWIAAGDAHSIPTPPGSDVPPRMKIAIRAWEILGLVGLAVFLYFFLVRPWIRERRITLDGLFCLGFFTIFWMDPGINFFSTWFTYNTYFVNVASWAPHIPGWLSPNGGNLPEPIVWLGGIYGSMLFSSAIVGGVLMRKLKQRRPQTSKFGLVMTCFATLFIVDFIFEPLFMSLGYYTFPGSISGLTINHGHYYQYPLYQPLTFGACMTAWACVRHFRNDKGQTFVERGIEQLRVGARARTAIRFLAIVGVLNVIYLTFNFTSALPGLWQSSWPEDIQKRPYLMDGFCGAGTTYACPSPELPNNRRGAAHIDPQGKVVFERE